MVWQIKFQGSAKRELAILDRPVQLKIRRYLRERIATDEDPRRFGDPLRRDLAGLWKYRVGGYRVICDIQDHILVVLVVRIGDRKNVYKKKNQLKKPS